MSGQLFLLGGISFSCVKAQRSARTLNEDIKKKTLDGRFPLTVPKQSHQVNTIDHLELSTAHSAHHHDELSHVAKLAQERIKSGLLGSLLSLGWGCTSTRARGVVGFAVFVRGKGHSLLHLFACR